MSNYPNLFDFNDYRSYLREWLIESKDRGDLNLSRLAKAAEVHSTFLSHVLKGTKQLSLEQSQVISETLQHSRLEREYFFTLVQLDRAGTKKLREYWLDKKQEVEAKKNNLSQRFDQHQELTSDQKAQFYSSWIYLAAWLCTSMSGGETVSDVSARFNLHRNQAEEILLFLVSAGLCKEQGGRYTMSEKHVHVSNESPFVTKHHMNWRMNALQRMDVRKENELFFSAPMAISQKDFETLREKINKVVKDVVDTAKASQAEEIVCLNIDFYRVES